MSTISELFGQQLSAINVGAAMFAEDIAAQGAKAPTWSGRRPAAAAPT